MSKQLENISKSFNIKKQDNTNDIYTFVGSSEIPDRDGDIIFIDGIDLNNFKNNPIVLFNHDRNEPIGKCIETRVENVNNIKSLVFDIEFSSTKDGQEIKTLIDEGILNTTSISFIPKMYELVDKNGRMGYDIKECELLEISIVAVPANPNALIQKMLELKNKLKSLENTETVEEEKEEIIEEITEEVNEEVNEESVEEVNEESVEEVNEENIEKKCSTPEEILTKVFEQLEENHLNKILSKINIK